MIWHRGHYFFLFHDSLKKFTYFAPMDCGDQQMIYGPGKIQLFWLPLVGLEMSGQISSQQIWNAMRVSDKINMFWHYVTPPPFKHSSLALPLPTSSSTRWDGHPETSWWSILQMPWKGKCILICSDYKREFFKILNFSAGLCNQYLWDTKVLRSGWRAHSFTTLGRSALGVWSWLWGIF